MSQASMKRAKPNFILEKWCHLPIFSAAFLVCIPFLMARLDLWVFAFWNGQLQKNGAWWELLCSLTNAELFDRAMYVALFVHGVATFLLAEKSSRREKFGSLIAYYLYFTIVGLVFKRIIQWGLGFHRLSPSLAIADATRIQRIDQTFYFKDTSTNSFPGDHALFLCCWAQFWSGKFSRSTGWTAWVIAIVFSVPRLFVHSHWASDLIVGGWLPSIIIAKTFEILEKRQPRSRPSTGPSWPESSKDELR